MAHKVCVEYNIGMNNFWNKIKPIIIKIFDWHGAVGKVVDTTLLIGIPLGLFIALISGKGIKPNTNPNDVLIWVGDSFILHNKYECCINYANTISEYNCLREDMVTYDLFENKFIEVNITIKGTESLGDNIHKLDKDDFKLKDHNGVLIPMNDIMSILGWNGIDIHWDVDDNGCVVSTADFDTIEPVIDYTWFGKQIDKNTNFTFSIYFLFNKEYVVENDIMILEVDFEWTYFFEHKGVDVCLLPRKNNL